jgi:O-antigen ligase/polysaccharide polymerase Wzy-like membrane protein
VDRLNDPSAPTVARPVAQRPVARRPSGSSSAASQPERPLADQLARLFPVAVVLGIAWVLSWRTLGSIAAHDWLPYALLTAIVLAGALFSGTRARPNRQGVAALGALLGLAAFMALSIAWAPLPSLARDQALLVLLYAVALAVALLTVRTSDDRLFATGAVAFGAVALTLAAALEIRTAANPADLFFGGRLEFPISYINAQAAAMLLGFWPAIAIAARRSAPLLVRALALGGSTSLLCGWLLTQSKGGIFALAVSAIAVFSVSGARLRLAVPVLISAAIAAMGYGPLTAPIRASSNAALEQAIRHGGTMLLLLSLGGVLAGAGYAIADRNVRPSRRTRFLAGRVALAGVGVAVICSLGALVVHGPGRLWSDFTVNPTVQQAGGTHLLSLGSNRADFWRVALEEFVQHPLGGVGAGGFGPAYLLHRDSGESPMRAHSVEADALSETGLVGFGLLALAIGLPLLAAARRARGEIAAAGAFGGAVYLVAHSSVDWTLTFPSVGIALFILLGTGASSGLRRSHRVSLRTTVAASAAMVALGLFAFGPPWLSNEYNNRAQQGGAGALGDVQSAETFDPLSVDPLITESQLAPTPAAAVRPLELAVEQEPQSYAMHYLLGLGYERVGRIAAARRELGIARRLNPHDPIVASALAKLRKR